MQDTIKNLIQNSLDYAEKGSKFTFDYDLWHAEFQARWDSKSESYVAQIYLSYNDELEEIYEIEEYNPQVFDDVAQFIAAKCFMN